jgi:hypothetical protein
MALDFDKMNVKSIDRILGYNLSTNALMFILDELQDATLTNGEETVYGTGKLGGRISSLKKNKTAGLTANNGFVVGGLLASQWGTDAEVAGTATLSIPYFEVLTAGTGGTSCTTTYAATGTAGAEIGFIYSVNSDGTQSTSYAQDTTAAATKFSYATATKVLTLPTSVFTEGDKVIVAYNYLAKGRKYVNKADVVSKNAKIVVELTIGDACETAEYPAYILMSNAALDGTFDLSLGGDQVVHSLTVNAIKNNCSTDKEFFQLLIPDNAA